MASSSLTLYDQDSGTTVYVLQSTSANTSRWVVAGRSLSKPKWIEISRKISPSGSSANDHVIVRVGQVEASTASPYPLKTYTATLDISIPRDLSGFGATTSDAVLALEKVCNNLISALNHKVALTSIASNTELTNAFSGADF